MKEVRCSNTRDNHSCNQKLFEYEGSLEGAKIETYCKKCKRVISVVDGRIKKNNL